jgi:DNA-directed DNA polymerase III PolC
MTIPNLRVRTEFSFKSVFGPVALVSETLAKMKCPAAAMVDVGTWGHAAWAKQLKKDGVKPMFGVEIVCPRADGKKPSCWALATETKDFYNLSSQALKKDADFDELMRNARGVIRFAGAALMEPDTFDYIDINPASLIKQKQALELHRKTGKPLVVTGDNAYPRTADYAAFMALSGREKLTPQHILSEAELRAALPCLTDAQFAQAVKNSFEIEERCADALPTAPIIALDGDLRKIVEEGKTVRLALRHITEWTLEYQSRMEYELSVIELKKFESYFVCVADLMEWAKKRMLCGPGRGSSAGSLVCYLLRITEIDPLKHGLMFERFMSPERNDMPDIDLDFSDVKRDECFAYLAEKYGAEKVARIGNINTLKPRSAMGKICERMAVQDVERFNVIDVLIDYSAGDARYGHSLEDTFAQTESGRRFAAKHPEFTTALGIENHASHTGVHAAGMIVCNESISDFCTVGESGVAQIDKPYAEAVNLLKIDALGLSTLGIIEDAGCVKADELYALTFDDPKVFALLNSHRFTGVFQFEGTSQRRIAAQIDIKSFREINHIVALARPGPMSCGATEHYIRRVAGNETLHFHHVLMEACLGATYGIVLFQEQVMRICAEIGLFDWKEVSAVRKLISLRKGEEALNVWREKFLAGAIQKGMKGADATQLWDEMVSFGAYGFNEAHSVAYGAIAYYTAWMKVYHPLEYAAACLRNAKDDEQALSLLRDMQGEGVDYVAFDADRSSIDWEVVDEMLIGGFKNLKGFGPAKASAAVEQRNAGKLNKEKIAKMEVKFAELRPLHTAYSDLYRNPENHGCRTGSVIRQLNELPDGGDVLTIGRVIKVELRDENEKTRLDRRNGKRIEGQTLFLNIIVSDDTGSTCTLRIDRYKYMPFGKTLFETLKIGDDLLCRGSRIPRFEMIKITLVKVLNREIKV